MEALYTVRDMPHLKTVLSNHPRRSQEDSCQSGKVHETHAGRCGCLGASQHGGNHHRPHCNADSRLQGKVMCPMLLRTSIAQCTFLEGNALECVKVSLMYRHCMNPVQSGYG